MGTDSNKVNAGCRTHPKSDIMREWLHEKSVKLSTIPLVCHCSDFSPSKKELLETTQSLAFQGNGFASNS